MNVLVHSVRVASSAGTAVLYRVDGHDFIVDVGGAWESVARANGGLPRVLGRPLWDFVAGRDVRAIWQLLLRHVRTEQTSLSFLYRCDSPGLPRVMQMELTPEPGGAVAFRSQFVRVLDEPSLTGRWDASGGRDAVEVCGWCGRVRAGDWLAPGRAVDLLGLSAPEARRPRLTHGICDGCVRELRGLMRT